jgi:CheY-like chemotaxis protein
MKTKERRKHIVLADDDKDHGIFFQRILHRIAPQVRFSQVYDGVALLDYIKQNAVDLLFLDLKMPCKNGHQCLEEIKADPRLNTLPVIVYSSSCHPADIQNSFIHQADLYLVKPFHAEHLKRALTAILSTWGQHLQRHYFINNRFVPYTATG